MAAQGGPSTSSAEPTTKRLEVKKQSLDDAYAAPANLLEIEVADPENHGFGRQRYTDYEIRMRAYHRCTCCRDVEYGGPFCHFWPSRKTNIPIFKIKESAVRRRYRDFEWLKKELERDSKILVPPLPGKAIKRQLPFRGDDGIFEDEFIEERRKGLEDFVNKIAGHPLAQNEKCLHMFLQDPVVDRSYVPGKVRSNN